MRRFWDMAEVAAEGQGFAVLLDGKPLRIPGRAGGAPLLLDVPALAHAVAAEWQAAGGAKGGTLSMEDVPLTRLAGTAQDRIAPDPAPVAQALAGYGETDLLCYRADHPIELAARQAKAWQPWLDWLERTHGARLDPTEGIGHRAQDAEALARIHAMYARQSPLVLAALGIAVPALGSAVLGLALAERALEAEEAFALSILDETFQAEKWGEDAAAVARRAHVRSDIMLAARLIELTRP